MNTDGCCPKCGGNDVREKLLSADCPEAYWDGVEREGQFGPPGRLWAQPGFRNNEVVKEYLVDTPGGTFINALFCNKCELGFIPNHLLKHIVWDGKKNVD